MKTLKNTYFLTLFLFMVSSCAIVDNKKVVNNEALLLEKYNNLIQENNKYSYVIMLFDKNQKEGVCLQKFNDRIVIYGIKGDREIGRSEYDEFNESYNYVINNKNQLNKAFLCPAHVCVIYNYSINIYSNKKSSKYTVPLNCSDDKIINKIRSIYFKSMALMK